MTDVATPAGLARLFGAVRARGVALGCGELLDAVRVLEAVTDATTGPDVGRLRRELNLLWCKTDADTWHLEQAWSASGESDIQQPPADETPLEADDVDPPTRTRRDRSVGDDVAVAASRLTLTPLPLQAPARLPAELVAPQLRPFWPVSRRFMAYIWRYLRRPLPLGYPDVFDLDGTVDRMARMGILTPIYKRREINAARVLLLLDHRGSMMPFHRYLRDLVETLRESRIEQQSVYYFSNVPEGSVYGTPYLTQPRPLADVVESIDGATSILVVSDAGAARGRPRSEARLRVLATLRFVDYVRQASPLVGWLNPMPVARWENTAAESVARMVPMFPMDEQGMSNLIDVVGGRGALR